MHRGSVLIAAGFGRCKPGFARAAPETDPLRRSKTDPPGGYVIGRQLTLYERSSARCDGPGYVSMGGAAMMTTGGAAKLTISGAAKLSI